MNNNESLNSFIQWHNRSLGVIYHLLGYKPIFAADIRSMFSQTYEGQTWMKLVLLLSDLFGLLYIISLSILERVLKFKNLIDSVCTLS